MESEPLAAGALRLLAELEQRALEDPRLGPEWRVAYREFAGDDASPATHARFREWFLLERRAQSFGCAPLQYWTPPSFDPDGPWAQLLDSFLGVFRLVEVAGEELVLEDLWSGRVISVPASALAEWDADSLAVGRFVTAGERVHEPLPGLLQVRVPGLPAAIELDLAEIRARDPRSRLSQGEIERLFAPFRPRPPALGLAALAGELRQALAGEPAWPLERLAARLAEVGAGEALNELAFDTGADLEQLRRLLPEYERALAADSADAAEPAPEAAPARSVAEALARLDAGRAAGKGWDELFRNLEQDLGLEPDSTREGNPLEEMERVALPADLRLQLDGYEWERRQAGRPLAREERRLLDELADFLRQMVPEGGDLRQLRPAIVLAFLLRSGEHHTQDTLASLLPFLDWATSEQEAPLEDLLPELHGRLGVRLEGLHACNQALAAAAVPASTRARIAATAPARVRDGSGCLAPVRGIAPEFAALVEPGDWVLGSWRDGALHAAALLPAAALEAPVDAPDGDGTAAAG